MKKKITSIFSIIAVTLLVVSCNQSQEKQGAGQQKQAMPFPVIKVEKRSITTHKSYPAKLQGEVSSEVRAKVSGYITELLVDEGDRVKKDQLLFKLETQSLNQDAAAAKANVNAAQVEVDKLKPLVEKNIISSVQLETAKAKLAQAKSNLNSVQANIGYANIKSPVDGIVGSINYRTGALVSGQDPKPLTTVSSIGKVYAYFSMNEKDFLDFIGETGTTEKQLKQLQKQHLAHLERMAQQGYTSLTGPFGDGGEIRGIVVYNTPTQKMADSLARLDPMVKAGRLTVEIHPWWAAKGSKLN